MKAGKKSNMDIEEYAKHIQFYSEELPPLVEQLFSGSTWRTVADIGCGDGGLILYLQKRGLWNDKEVYAVDLSSIRIEQIKKINSNIHTYVASATHIPEIKNGLIDRLISSQVIEHVDDDFSMLLEMRRIIAESGSFYLSTVFKKWYGWYFYRCNGKWVLDPTHLREYSSESVLLDKVKAAGFDVVENKKTLFWFPITDFFLKRLLSSKDVRTLYSNKFLKILRTIKIPILGYYNWELILRPNSLS